VKRVVVVVAAAIAIAAAIGWQREYSREARIERAYASCMRQFGGAAPSRAAPARPVGSPGANAPDPRFADSLDQAMQDLVKGVTAGMSGAVCGAVRDACQADFDGAVCRNALAGFT
jgi:hypothetical protein